MEQSENSENSEPTTVSVYCDECRECIGRIPTTISEALKDWEHKTKAHLPCPYPRRNGQCYMKKEKCNECRN